MSIGKIILTEAFRHHSTGEVSRIAGKQGGLDVGMDAAPANESSAPAFTQEFKL